MQAREALKPEESQKNASHSQRRLLKSAKAKAMAEEFWSLHPKHRETNPSNLP